MEETMTQQRDRYSELEEQFTSMQIKESSELDLLSDMYSSLKHQAESLQRMINSDTKRLMRQLEYNAEQIAKKGFDANLDSVDLANMIEAKRRDLNSTVHNLNRLHYRLQDLLSEK